MGFRERKRQRAVAQAEEAESLAQVRLSTLGTSERAFEEVGLVWGDSAPNEEQALWNLQRTARECGIDAVLGISLYSAGSERLFSGRRRNDEWRAFGTGVRWLP